MQAGMYGAVTRGSWLLLTLWQPYWHGWLVPERWLLGVIFGLVMLLPLPGIWLLRARSIIVGGLMAIGLLVIASMELIAAAWLAVGAGIQALLCGIYLGAVMWRGRRLKQLHRSGAAVD